ncbi:glycosyltransferase family 2 protein [Kineococcus auxinigenes]|uniref:glycosyltransferase family 2 protein n=1 Tax=unclassified Kineococcus TaxID=2621656 RepID=UPI003D7CC282
MIIRTYNSRSTLQATIDAVRAQTCPVEIVLVDSGSTDGTLDLARSQVDRLVELDHAEFSYGRALNRGAEVAGAPVHVSLSSHTVLPRPDWVEIARRHLQEGALATCGAETDGAHRPLQHPLRADREYFARHRYWGYTNTAGAWRAEAWQVHRFDESLVASEDQEWSWRLVADGGHVLVDPALAVSGSHRRSAGLQAYHRRMVAEIRALEHMRPLRPYGVLDGLADWVRTDPRDPFVSHARRFGRTRLLDVTARWSAGVQSRRGTVPQPRILPDEQRVDGA